MSACDAAARLPIKARGERGRILIERNGYLVPLEASLVIAVAGEGQAVSRSIYLSPGSAKAAEERLRASGHAVEISVCHLTEAVR